MVTHDDLMNKHERILHLCGYLEVSEGWYSLIDSLCTDLQVLADASDLQVEALQIKEKFGGLRFYVINATGEMLDRIAKAEDASFTICETCGEPGERINKGGWLTTRCEKHK